MSLDINNSEKHNLPDGWKWKQIQEVAEIYPRRSKDFQRNDGELTTFVPMPSVCTDKGY